MSEKGTRNLSHYLKAGWALSIQEMSREALAATVSTVSARSLSLELSGPRAGKVVQRASDAARKVGEAADDRWEERRHPQRADQATCSHGPLGRGVTADGRVTWTVSRPGSETNPCPLIVLDPR